MRVAGAVAQVVELAAELVQAGDGACRQRGGQAVGKQRAKQRQMRLAGKFAQGAQRLVADATLWGGHGAQKGRVVVLVDPQAQPGAQVLDLGAVEKTLSARHLVRDLRAPQRLLEHTRLVVGAVQDGEVAPVLGCRGLPQRLDACHRTLGLVRFVVAVHHAHRLALAQLGIEPLGKQLGVGADDVVGRAQDGTRGAVVLLQLDDLQLRIVLRQAPQVVQRGAAPAVDALVVVTHGGEGAGLAHQPLHQLVLGGVGVLVFVHQHMGQARLPLVRHLLVIL